MKIREAGVVKNKAVHFALGVGTEGNKEVLGFWQGAAAVGGKVILGAFIWHSLREGAGLVTGAKLCSYVNGSQKSFYPFSVALEPVAMT
jgi:hypothetical protein